MSGSRERTSSKRGRNIHHSGSTSNFNGSQDAIAPSHSTPSFNYASSRCMEDLAPQELSLAETADLDVRPVWLEARDGQRYLLLEDAETGDVMMPLTKLKEILGDNYSRALNNTDNRFVIKCLKLDFGPYETANNLYWMWPFESPSHVKSLIRRELQDYSAGHIRLVLVPVVYNAMTKIHQDARAKKRDDSRLTPTFLALEEALGRTLFNSSYAPLLHFPTEPETYSLRDCETLAFEGPRDTASTAAKYMSTQKVVSRKKAKVEARNGIAAVVTKQELVEIAKQETAGIAELQAQMQSMNEQVKIQDKKLERLSEELKETRSLFSRMFEVFTCGPRGTTQPVHLPQVHSVPNLDKAWHVDQFGRYLLPPRSKSATAAQGYTHVINAPAISTALEQQIAAGALQQPIACPQFLSLTQQLAQLPVQNPPAAFPSVANTGHHLCFPDPQTPGSHDPTGQNFRGTEKPMMMGTSSSSEQLKTNAHPTYEDYVRHVFPFKSGMENRQDDVSAMF